MANCQRVLAERRGDLVLAHVALADLREAEAVLREGGHEVNADIVSGYVTLAESIVAELTS
ncbi:hypothetical protein FEV53_04080 [Palleronia caenipelagi]|uniref:Uncharacterized protein n=1 Tax=Palleronia caenipelagi TaxID=2489174 RepID=A0A547Q899_9RHOB|nr:hypothetical protein FEV53_04080 [Palleronia caenipelagi]